jgi:carboxyl-terminal processing protease
MSAWIRFSCWMTMTTIALALCGGCGGDEPLGPSYTYADRCATPRPGTSDIQGSVDTEKQWLRAWTDELYLWYREVPDYPRDSYPTAVSYFNVLKTPAITASGKQKDQFHFYYPTDYWIALSTAGSSAGYGVQWAFVTRTLPRQIFAAYTEPGSPAELAPVPIARGAQLLKVDGVDAQTGNTQAEVDALNAGLFPTSANQTHTLTIRDPGADPTSSRDVVLTSANVVSVPVQKQQVLPMSAVGNGDRVGYVLFNDHLGSAEHELIDAVTGFNDGGGLTDLIIDMRYNGGGFLSIASQLAYMIAGSARTAGKAFERLQYNDQYPNIDPFSGGPNLPFPFLNATSDATPQALPSLALPRVFILTSGATCSASESVINSLRGIDVEVILVGTTTCGKPYGFFPADNCGNTYFSIQFQGVNQKGFGDYADGFIPGGSAVTSVTNVPGCSVADDLGHPLGDPAEAMLAAALQYRATGTCPATKAVGGDEVTVPKPAWLTNRIMRR